MAASFLRVGGLGSLKVTECVLVGSRGTLFRVPAAAFCVNAGDPKKPVKKTSITQADPIQKLFIDKIREYSAKSKSTGSLVDAGPEYERNLAEEVNRLQRLYGGGDLNSFPEFKFPEPKLEEVSPK
uniref:ATP synthase peripheral stalk subunit F6, mitochondrial n=1 Tax=Scleropages formosus TaxID=113540 RepID=A0A8C9VZT8_SCLFO